jgi:hypothetical protein
LTRPVAFAAWTLALLCAAAAPLRADNLELLPQFDLHLEFGRYAPTETDFVFDSWLGGKATLLRHGATAIFMTGDVETVLGREFRVFDANQANYVLEGGLTRDFGLWSVSGVFHHVSRHVIDRPKRQSVDWNLVGVRAERRFMYEGGAGAGRAATERGRVELGAAHQIKHTFVLYNWEFRAAAEYDLLPAGGGALYARATLRAITEEKTLDRTRGGFIDALAEGGWRVRRGRNLLHFYVAYEHRNDVYLMSPSAQDRALVGFRVGRSNNPGW